MLKFQFFKLNAISVITTIIITVAGQAASDWWPPPSAKFYRPGLITVVSTPEGGSARYTVDDRRHFIFQVRACHSALLSFGTLVNDVEKFVVEVGLGVHDNRLSFIRFSQSASTKFETSTPNLLHCNEFRTFWISWHNEYFKVGKGSALDQQVFMNLMDPKREHFNAVSLGCTNSSYALWKLQENSGEWLIADTPDEHKYERIWKEVTDRKFWTFKVRAGGDVHVILTEQFGATQDNIYEFVVGGWSNNRSVIRTAVLGGDDAIKDSIDIKNLVSASEAREFWISWANGQLELGQGGIYAKDRLLKWKDGYPRNIRYLSITTGFGNIGRWWILDERESVTNMLTEPTSSLYPEDRYNRFWISTPRQEVFTFSVKSCKDVTVLLSDSLVINQELAIEIAIGSSDNTVVAFRYLNGQGNLAEAYSTFLLSCTEHRIFWISWVNGTVRIGTGPVYSHNLILEKQLFDAVEGGFKVGALGLATSATAGEWRIRETTGERVHIYTPSNFNEFGIVWRTIFQEQSVVFRVKACSDCHVSLSPTLGVDYAETYLDMVIGGWQNTKSQIRKVIGPDGAREDFSAAVSTPQLLNCDRHVDLWVSWDQMKMRMGQGSLPGYHVLLDHQLTTPYPVTAISLSSGWGYAGDFSIDEDVGDYFLFYTGIHESIRWAELSSYITWIHLKIRACKELNVYLCPQLSNNGCYKLILGTQNNTKSMLYDSDNVVAEADTPNLFSCYDNRYFWFRWNGNGKLEIGHGSIPGFNTFISFDQVDRNILALGFESTSDDYNSRWQIYLNTMISMTFYTPDFLSYEQVWESVDHRHGVTFGVSACSDVHIVLSSQIRNFTQVYDVVIGGWSNTQSVIRISSEGKHYAEVSTPDILHCSERRFFWLTWQYNAIEVGRGEIIGKQRFMDYQPLQFYGVRAIGYSTGYGQDGNWFIKGTAASPTEVPATAAPEPSETLPAENSGGLSQDAVAGIVIGVIGGLLLLVLVALYIYDRRMDAASTHPSTTPSLPTGETADAGALSPGNEAPEETTEND